MKSFQVLLLVWIALSPRALAQDPPNILWLTVEDMSPWIGCYGDDTVPTPNLDRLARESVRYSNAFAGSPVCAAARSSLITGMYASRIGTMHHRTGKPSAAAVEKDPQAYAEIPSYEGVPPAFVRCFPELLRASGYYCTNASKTDYQFQAPATVWNASGGKAHWRNRPAGSPFFAVFNHGGTHESQAFPKSKRRPSKVSVEDVPIPPLYPDTPAVRDALTRTYDNIAAMDAWVGKQLDALEQAGLAKTTVVFFFSDHGVGLPRGKRSPYDLGLRVPLLVRNLNGAQAGSVEQRVVSFIDFGPSVLSIAGILPDARLDGVPFLGAHARGGSGLSFAHADRFDSVYDAARTVTDGRYRYVRNLDPQLPHLIANVYRENLPMMDDLYALRETRTSTPEQWQVASTERPTHELYDSRLDPWEVHNLAEAVEHAQTLDRLSTALDEWIEETGDLGQVLPESKMVHEHLWHGKSQPKTATATLRRDGELLALECETDGASLGYRVGEQRAWSVYTDPFEVNSSAKLEVLTHRIGFSPARISFELP